MKSYLLTGLSLKKSVKAGARLGPQWSSVCVGIDIRRGGLMADLPTQGASDVRAAQVVYSGGAWAGCLHMGCWGVCRQLPMWPEQSSV